MTQQKNAGHLFRITSVFCKGRVGVEPTRDGFAIRCLSHLAIPPICGPNVENLIGTLPPRQTFILSNHTNCVKFDASGSVATCTECIGKPSTLLQAIPVKVDPSGYESKNGQFEDIRDSPGFGGSTVEAWFSRA